MSQYAVTRGDIFGGLTAGVVALPLCLAFGVASGLRFSDGLVTLNKEPLSGISQQVKVGGTLVFVGARVRLGG